jgi:hypothetical protein
MRPALKPFSAFASAVWIISQAGPALAVVPKRVAKPASVHAIDLDKLQFVARKEGLPLATIRLAGPHKLQLASHEVLPRAAFLKRAGLLAFVVFNRLPSKVEEIQFTNRSAGSEQSCHIGRADFNRYLRDGISKAEYERRLTYREQIDLAAVSSLPTGGERVSAPPSLPVPPLPDVPETQLPALPPLRPLPSFQGLLPTSKAQTMPNSMTNAGVPLAVGPGVPSLNLLAFNYGIALGGARFDAFQLEYARPILPTLDIRPSVQIISGFSPLNYMGGTSRIVDGLSFACDLLGTTRQHPGAGGLAFEGGIGARMATLSGASGGTWPALHLRMGARWQGLSLGMRYPLLHRDSDPTGTWEATVGYSVPFSAFGIL